MKNNSTYSLKSIIAIAIFCLFWLFTFLQKICPKTVSSKASSINWIYTQTFNQNFSFFTQPAIYNDRLLVRIRDKQTQKLDSVDAMQLLWNEKKNSFNYTYSNIWDHIMFRNIHSLRETKNQTQIDTNLIHNFNVFVKTILLRNKYDLSNKEFQFQLITDYTKPLNRKAITGYNLEYTSIWTK